MIEPKFSLSTQALIFLGTSFYQEKEVRKRKKKKPHLPRQVKPRHSERREESHDVKDNHQGTGKLFLALCSWLPTPCNQNMEHWNNGTLENWNIGKLEHWKIGTINFPTFALSEPSYPMNIITTSLLNDLSDKARASERLRINHNFHLSPESKSQRLLNAIEPGTQIPIHKHDNTPETYILLRGRLRVDFYDDNNTITESAILDPREGMYGIDIPAGQLHTVEVLEHGTVIFECKDGPYLPIL